MHTMSDSELLATHPKILAGNIMTVGNTIYARVEVAGQDKLAFQASMWEIDGPANPHRLQRIADRMAVKLQTRREQLCKESRRK